MVGNTTPQLSGGSGFATASNRTRVVSKVSTNFDKGSRRFSALLTKPLPIILTKCGITGTKRISMLPLRMTATQRGETARSVLNKPEENG
jgi:hypothetical protein